MKKLLRFLLGLNLASFVNGFRFGPKDLVRSAFAALAAVFPFQDRVDRETRRIFESFPTKPLAEILGDARPVVSFSLRPREDGALGVSEMVTLLGLLIAEQPREIVEVGTFMGQTAKCMAEALPNSIVHTIDLPEDFQAGGQVESLPPKDDFHLIAKREVGREFKGLPCAARIVQHLADTATFDFAQLGHPTFFLIDGSHTYEYCRQDSEKCLALCPKGSTFLWHDCDPWHPGVLKFLLEWRESGRDIVRIEDTYFAYWKS